MHYTCPVCNAENKHILDFKVEEYICHSCSNLIDTDKNISKKIVKKPTENVVLDTNNKGIIDGVEYFVTGIVVRKYGSSTFWREYYLKDKNNKDAFLSESDGHWVFLLPQDEPLKENGWHCEFKGKKYRWYESTPCNLYAAQGFFEEKLNFKLANYTEFVNGKEMVSWEKTGNKQEYFWGKHISKQKIKNRFKPYYMPEYYGIGIVQPFYINIKQLGNIFGIAALLICLVQLYISSSRTNATVFSENIPFHSVKDKEMVSKSFELNGGSAPMEVTLRSNVDNSWANTELSLVNEKTNEITYTSQDIEYYHGYEDGENWSEGSQKKEFNFCGIAPGKYHFLISAEKQTGSSSESIASEAISVYDNGAFIVSRKPNGYVDVYEKATGNSTTYDNIEHFRKDSANRAASENILENNTLQNQDSAKNAPVITETGSSQNSDVTDNNPDIEILAKWKPVSFWNFGIVLALIIGLYAFLRLGKYYFDKSKWNNSSNSPYE